jgi:tRNA pseudouridine55 synthase
MPDADWHGVLPVDKPAGPSSHDVVARARRALGTRRVGHTGTLDPFATGLLLLCVGTATRIAEQLVGLDKRYLATMRLGIETDTDDATGTPVAGPSAELPDSDRVAAVLGAFAGTHEQRPPAYSARKVGGERLYRAARRGAVVDAAPRLVTIHAIRLLAYRPPDADFEVHCGSGTYIRAIARDAGRVLGCGAHLAALRRTRVGRFGVEAAIPLDALEEPGAADAARIPAAEALAHLPAVVLDDAGLARIRHGQRLPGDGADAPEVRLLHDGRLVALASRRDGVLHPRKVLDAD